MDRDQYYEKLRRNIDKYPLGMPAGPEALAVLKRLFTPEEAMLASELPMAPKIKRPEQIAARFGLEPGHARRVLQSLADRGRIMPMPYKGRPWGYSIFPSHPGVFELPLMVPGLSDEEKRDMGRAWQEYFDAGLSRELQDRSPAPLRVLPVRKSIQSQPAVYDYEDIRSLIRAAEIVSVGACACRTAFRNCDAPIETCLIFDFMAEYLAARGMVRLLKPDEAFEILDKTEEAGLVHCSVNVKSEPSIICNCCECCCTFLRGIGGSPLPNAVAASGFMAGVDAEKCSGCNRCVRVCPTRALAADAGGPPRADHRRCIGCGLCVSHCPENAVLFQRPRDQRPPTPANWVDFTFQRWARNGRLGAVLRHLLLE